jgi:hypothetical protein
VKKADVDKNSHQTKVEGDADESTLDLFKDGDDDETGKDMLKVKGRSWRRRQKRSANGASRSSSTTLNHM